VLFPLLSAVQTERRKVGAAYLLGVALIGVFGGAVSLGVSAAATDLVRVVLGPQWAESAAVVRVLAVAVPFVFMSQIGGAVCDALALLRFKLLVQGSALAVLAALMLALTPWGVGGIALAICLSEVLRFSVLLGFLSRELGCARADVLRVLGGVATASVLAWAACSGAAALSASLALGPFVALGLEMLAGLAALALGGWLALRLLEGTEPGRLAERSLPGWRRMRARLRLGLESADALP